MGDEVDSVGFDRRVPIAERHSPAVGVEGDHAAVLAADLAGGVQRQAQLVDLRALGEHDPQPTVGVGDEGEPALHPSSGVGEYGDCRRFELRRRHVGNPRLEGNVDDQHLARVLAQRRHIHDCCCGSCARIGLRLGCRGASGEEDEGDAEDSAFHVDAGQCRAR